MAPMCAILTPLRHAPGVQRAQTLGRFATKTPIALAVSALCSRAYRMAQHAINFAQRQILCATWIMIARAGKHVVARRLGNAVTAVVGQYLFAQVVGSAIY
ncbi:MAG: hypothetical protein QXS54_03165 [Candidatus Methanomethylicaceae archaeon]